MRYVTSPAGGLLLQSDEECVTRPAEQVQLASLNASARAGEQVAHAQIAPISGSGFVLPLSCIEALRACATIRECNN